ncbi:squalene/phytoene synthase family protein [Caulobacter sp. S45]|uniref:phytoene/squalene synthase family protein n=1 Tax=Caulobacter sp. S45 TaxID=1641861 RepID=UPI00131D78EF|nr:squalene/phytoene synthase family protein [Caulobacter sp. S45]
MAEQPAPTKAEDDPTDLDALVRRLDPDRWLASRFIADPEKRRTVIALYALNGELARVGESVSNPLAGEIRLAWWRERMEAIAAGAEAPGQPALLALAEVLKSGALPGELLDALVEARHADLEPEPFADDAALARYLDGTAGAVMGLAARALDPKTPLRAVVEAGRAWGLAGLYRARAFWRAGGRNWVPASWNAPDEPVLAERVRAEVDAALARARSELGALSVAAFPAVAYVGLAGSYAHGRTPGELERRGRLLLATLRGRV